MTIRDLYEGVTFPSTANHLSGGISLDITSADALEAKIKVAVDKAIKEHDEKKKGNIAVIEGRPKRMIDSDENA